MKVSVVLPCYDGAVWVGEAIKSILVQTYPNFELVIVDDGSTDDSAKVVSSYLPNERIRYIYQKNRGFSAAVNRGIRESKGNLIGFIGQDDYWLSVKTVLQVSYLSQHTDKAMVHSDYFAMDADGRTMGVCHAKVPKSSSIEKSIQNLFLNNYIGFETALVRRECLDEVGLLDEGMIAFSDHDLWLRLAENHSFGYLSLPLVKKRQHPLQLSRVKVESALRDEFMLVHKAAIHYPFLGNVVRWKLASLYYSWGATLMEEGRLNPARRKFLRAMECQPWKLKAALAYFTPTLFSVVFDRYVGASTSVHLALGWLEG